MLTLVEEDVQMAQLRQAETLHQTRIVIFELLAHRGQLLLGELPVFPLGGFPVVGRHGVPASAFSECDFRGTGATAWWLWL